MDDHRRAVSAGGAAVAVVVVGLAFAAFAAFAVALNGSEGGEARHDGAPAIVGLVILTISVAMAMRLLRLGRRQKPSRRA